jgi:hypothetical protein
MGGDMGLWKIGFIAVYYLTATGQQITKPPYFVYQSKPKCEFDTRQLAAPASPDERPVWRIECQPGTPTGPKK